MNDYDEYDYKLISAFNNVVEDHLASMSRIKCADNSYVEIDTINSVSCIPNTAGIKKHELLSGNEFECIVDGEIRLMKKIENGAISKVVEFSIRPAKAKFDTQSEKFIVTDMKQFQPIGIKRY